MVVKLSVNVRVQSFVVVKLSVNVIVQSFAMEVDIATLTSGYVDTGTEEEEDEVMEGVEEGWSGSDDDNTLRSVESEMLKVGDD